MNEKFYKEILNFKPFNEQERQDKKVFLKYLKAFDDIFYRENEFAHITSSPWILNEAKDKVLMVYHNIYRSWGWCGGHCDGNENCVEVALKEGKEETGLNQLHLLNSAILAIDILPVPPHYKRGKYVTSHVHLNVTYACIAKEIEMIFPKLDENSGVKWIPVDEISFWVKEEDMKPVYKKLMEKVFLLGDK